MLGYFIQHRFAVLVISLSLVISGCGFKLRGVTQVPPELSVLLLDSYDPYGPLTRIIDKQLRSNGIKIESDHLRTDIPSLRIKGYNERKDTVSIFRDGKTAEHQLVLTVDAQIFIPGKDIYPVTVSVSRTFFDNPLFALAKDAEYEIIIKEMREQIALKLVRKLLSANTEVSKDQIAVLNSPE